MAVIGISCNFDLSLSHRRVARVAWRGRGTVTVARQGKEGPGRVLLRRGIAVGVWYRTVTVHVVESFKRNSHRSIKEGTRKCQCLETMSISETGRCISYCIGCTCHSTATTGVLVVKTLSTTCAQAVLSPSYEEDNKQANQFTVKTTVQCQVSLCY